MYTPNGGTSNKDQMNPHKENNIFLQNYIKKKCI